MSVLNLSPLVSKHLDAAWRWKGEAVENKSFYFLPVRKWTVANSSLAYLELSPACKSDGNFRVNMIV